MARRRYLVAYDIRDDRRLRSVAVCMKGYGTRIQYSVFVCDLSDRERITMRGDVEAIMKLSEDSVMIVDLGLAGDVSRFLFLGIMRDCHHRRLASCERVSAVFPGRPFGSLFGWRRDLRVTRWCAGFRGLLAYRSDGVFAP